MLSEKKQKILNRIKEYERQGLFDKDVEDDPPSTILLPQKVDYLNEKPFSELKSKLAYKLGEMFYHRLEKKGEILLKAVYGKENFKKVSGGAIITCNHFAFYDNYFIAKTFKKELGKHGLYKVIREGNYTGFRGFFGFLFRHARTLPLSSNIKTMQKFYSALKTLLSRGEKILIYPEQAMWWNYRKPRPYKNGAFRFAVKNKVPIIPMFMTMEDTERLDSDASSVQAVSLFVLPPIYPDENLTEKENEKIMAEKNYNAVKSLYEKFYSIPLSYSE